MYSCDDFKVKVIFKMNLSGCHFCDFHGSLFRSNLNLERNGSPLLHVIHFSEVNNKSVNPLLSQSYWIKLYLRWLKPCQVICKSCFKNQDELGLLQFFTFLWVSLMHSYDLIENYLKNLSTVIIDKSWISICAFSSKSISMCSILLKWEK